MITATQKTRMTCAFLALLDAAKAVVEPGAFSEATAPQLLTTLAAAVVDVDVTCAAIEIEQATGLDEDTPPSQVP